MKRTLSNILNLKLTCLGKEIPAIEVIVFKEFLNSLRNSYIVFRCLDDRYLNKQYCASTENINVLSKHVFLYGDKGKIFYDDLDQKTYNIDINDFGPKESSYIYDKIQKIFIKNDISSSKTKEYIKSFNTKEIAFVSFWRKITKAQWSKMISGLTKEDKIKVKDYYIALLHTVGLAGYGRNSYFLSTSLSSSIDKIMDMNYSVEIVGWTSKKDINKYGKDFFQNKNSEIKALGFPTISNAVFPTQKEITYKCGILPHFIIGYIYNQGKNFEINPCMFKKQDFSTVSKTGLSVDQSEFYKKLNQTNYKSTYIYMDDLFFQI